MSQPSVITSDSRIRLSSNQQLSESSDGKVSICGSVRVCHNDSRPLVLRPLLSDPERLTGCADPSQVINPTLTGFSQNRHLCLKYCHSHRSVPCKVATLNQLLFYSFSLSISSRYHDSMVWSCQKQWTWYMLTATTLISNYFPKWKPSPGTNNFRKAFKPHFLKTTIMQTSRGKQHRRTCPILDKGHRFLSALYGRFFR